MFVQRQYTARSPIVIYDSGVGGLSIVKAVKQLLPQESIHYIADTQNFPYGQKNSKELFHCIRRILDFCLCRSYKLCIMACNTATAASTSFLPAYLKAHGSRLPIVNVIDPLVAHMVAQKRYRTIGLIGTTYTIASGIHQQRLQSMHAHLVPLALPKLADNIESSFLQAGGGDFSCVNDDLEPLMHKDIDALILGCTHYTFVQEAIQNWARKTYPHSIDLIRPDELVAKAVAIHLTTHHMRSPSATAQDCFMATALTPSFQQAVQQLFQKQAIMVESHGCYADER